MPHDTSLISTIVGGLVLAFIFGTIANRFRLPPLVGYLFAGMLVGPHTPGFVADQELAPQLAELGVILLMFGVGLHFALKDLLSVRFIAVPGAIGQIAIATLLGWGLHRFTLGHELVRAVDTLGAVSGNIGLAGGGVKLGKLSRLFDGKVIDGWAVNGSAGLVGFTAGLVRKLQSGYLYHYAFAMILGLVALLALANRYWL